VWDKRKERSAHEWEFRRYRANLVHSSALGLQEAFFAAKTELVYLVGILESLLVSLRQLSDEAEALIRQQVGAQLTVVELQQRRNQLLQPYRVYNDQQVALRWNQYEQKMKEVEAKSRSFLSVLQPLIPEKLERLSPRPPRRGVSEVNR